MSSSGIDEAGISGLALSTITPALPPNPPGLLAAIMTRLIFAVRLAAALAAAAYEDAILLLLSVLVLAPALEALSSGGGTTVDAVPTGIFSAVSTLVSMSSNESLATRLS